MMRLFDEQSFGSLSREENRLETPTTIGFRDGMSSSGVIGRKLCTVYSVDDSIPHEIDVAIQELHDRLD